MIGSILVAIDGEAAGRPALDTALTLAARFDCALTGLGLIAPFSPPAFLADDEARALADRATETAERHLDRLTRIFADAVHAAELSARAEWLVIEGPPTAVLAEQARYAGLLVHARPDRHAPADSGAVRIETVILDAGRPVLLVPPAAPAMLPGRRALIAWNNSRESARAVADALPFLRGAEAVRIVSIAAGADDGGPAAELAMALARAGIDSEPVSIDSADAPDPGATLIALAAEHRADLIVAGARADLRWQEISPGGVTRTLLDSAPVPVLLSH